MGAYSRDHCLLPAPAGRYNFVGQMETLSEDVAFLGAAFPEIRPHLRSVFRRKWNSNAVAVAVAKEEEGRAEEPTLTSKYGRA